MTHEMLDSRANIVHVPDRAPPVEDELDHALREQRAEIDALRAAMQAMRMEANRPHVRANFNHHVDLDREEIVPHGYGNVPTSSQVRSDRVRYWGYVPPENDVRGEGLTDMVSTIGIASEPNIRTRLAYLLSRLKFHPLSFLTTLPFVAVLP